LAVEGFTLSETRYRPCFQTARHSHEHAFLYVVLEGGYEEVLGRTTLASEHAELRYRTAGEPHSHGSGESGARCFNIDFDGRWIERVCELSPRPPVTCELRGGLPASLAGRLYREFTQPDGFAALTIQGLALELLAEACRHAVQRPEKDAPKWLVQARELVHEEFTERLTLAEIADVVGIHPVHLARVFRQQYRCTVGDYVRRLRVEYACREIARTHASLAEIALAAGFSEQSQFTRTFKRVTGLTPAQYRGSVCRR
jgi:AraC family transcriptional regulator